MKALSVFHRWLPDVLFGVILGPQKLHTTKGLFKISSEIMKLDQ